jgi:2-polyprenyl-3-methyl-5-hydroxy-6-metoxy-1,4-benzoquinol methylase
MDQQDWNEYYQNTDEVWAETDRDLIAEVEQIPAGRAIDLGAGEGINSLWLAEQGWQVTAVDYAPAAVAKIERAARQLDLPIQAQVADIVIYQAAAEYDLVVICYVHLPPKDRKQLLMNAAAALTDSGTLLFIGFPNGDAFAGEYEHEDEESSSDSDNLFATGEEIIALLPDNLTIEQNKTTKRTFPWREETFTSDVVVIRARRVD